MVSGTYRRALARVCFDIREHPKTIELLYSLIIGWFYIAGTTCALWFLGGDDAFHAILIGSAPVRRCRELCCSGLIKDRFPERLGFIVPK
jgi:hypothetical protein